MEDTSGCLVLVPIQTCCDPSPLTLREFFNAGMLGSNQVGQKVAGRFLMAACVCDAVCLVTIHLNVQNVHAEMEFFSEMHANL